MYRRGNPTEDVLELEVASKLPLDKRETRKSFNTMTEEDDILLQPDVHAFMIDEKKWGKYAHHHVHACLLILNSETMGRSATTFRLQQNVFRASNTARQRQRINQVAFDSPSSPQEGPEAGIDRGDETSYRR